MKKKRSTKETTAENLEARFESGASVLDYFDTEITRLNLDLPKWAVREIDREATRRGIARQALIKNWLVDLLDGMREAKKKA
jgi:hypothetical protein